ncbi:M48 family metallopeptidase [Streptomyces sp. AD55]|uniref:M48 metallopeptidase family protein n=1 Tax=Streptomyces sp. AD55 TaxID=3242895 RepID=UPI0035280319
MSSSRVPCPHPAAGTGTDPRGTAGRTERRGARVGHGGRDEAVRPPGGPVGGRGVDARPGAWRRTRSTWRCAARRPSRGRAAADQPPGRLFRRPRHPIGYVVSHEPAHVKVSGHREDFWRLLRTALPEYEERRADLDELGRRLWTGDVRQAGPGSLRAGGSPAAVAPTRSP